MTSTKMNTQNVTEGSWMQVKFEINMGYYTKTDMYLWDCSISSETKKNDDIFLLLCVRTKLQKSGLMYKRFELLGFGVVHHQKISQ